MNFIINWEAWNCKQSEEEEEEEEEEEDVQPHDYYWAKRFDVNMWELLCVVLLLGVL